MKEDVICWAYSLNGGQKNSYRIMLGMHADFLWEVVVIWKTEGNGRTTLGWILQK
jgi:hypothetical protein